jgi:surface antigen
VRLLSARGGTSTLDATTTATVAADVADKSHLLVASAATQAATQLSDQVAITTSDDTTLAKPQVVTTAGDVTRGITNYTVLGGDTISTIATKFNITTGTIEAANNLSDGDSIAPGQTLVILPITGLLYTVQSGDTAASLASTYDANAAQILSYNNDETNGLTPGAKIIIPDGVKPQPVQAAVAAVNTPATKYSSGGSAAPLTHYAGGSSANSYDYGYCTYYVATRRSVPAFWGNAVDWYYNAQASGFSVGSVPEAGAIAWTGAGYDGHVAYVESASGGNVTISEMNGTAGWGRVDTRTVPASSFLYIY